MVNEIIVKARISHRQEGKVSKREMSLSKNTAAG